MLPRTNTSGPTPKAVKHQSIDVLNYLSSRVPNYFLVDSVHCTPRQFSLTPVHELTLYFWHWEVLHTPGPNDLYSVKYGATVAERLDCSPPTKANLVQSPAGSLPGFLQEGIVPVDAAGWRVFLGISRSPHPFIPVLLHTHLTSPFSALETSMLRADKSLHSLIHSLDKIRWGLVPSPFYTRLLLRLLASKVKTRKSDKGDSYTQCSLLIALTRKACISTCDKGGGGECHGDDCVLRSIIAAVSPAVVVPSLFRLRKKGYGVSKGIPTLVIAVSSIDDALSVAAFGIISSIMFTSGRHSNNPFLSISLLFRTSFPCTYRQSQDYASVHGKVSEEIWAALNIGSSEPMRVIEANMEQRRNEGAGEAGDPRVNPPTNGSSGTFPTCENPEGEQPNRSAPVAPCSLQSTLTFQILQGPITLVGGVGFGVVWGLLSKYVPERSDPYVVPLRILMLLGGGMLAMLGSEGLGVGGAGPLSCVTSAFVSITCWSQQGWEIEDNPVATAFEIFWMIFEPILFGITGTQLKLNELDGDTVAMCIVCLVIAIVARILATVLLSWGSKLNLKEKIFVSLAWMSKAGVQAALGPVALSSVASGTSEEKTCAGLILTASVLSILLTAPTGAVVITLSGSRLLKKTSAPQVLEGWRRSRKPSMRDFTVEEDHEEERGRR
ncbi:hypothetical protein PR048_031749 [Dryococelus australis]|uniref:Cation/H+ exchanger transmembrane domain-containing protein n=1 Tax=Dryococelus australis TaxID=614101 RepID=A0ABQ9G653_9NEOP|nr:hypothetical protein PR048_031749 [Dryococelus australis]